jgi:23S rRNA pseudouridine1911/1915/1917 synthase
MPHSGAFTLFVDTSDAGKRLDVLIAAKVSDYSRSHIAGLIVNGKIQVDGVVKKPGYRVNAGDEIQVVLPLPESVSFDPEPIEIDIIYEDEDLIIIDKPAGFVVHPAPGHHTGTLVHALLYRYPALSTLGEDFRSGIVHRLDKNTSGLLIVAKNPSAHEKLTAQFKSRKIRKTYRALVWGEMKADSGVISLPVGRHPVDRKRMSTHSRKARSAETWWKVRERFDGLTLLELDLKTGRTHQIRVHCAAIHHPIVGDPVYGGRQVRKNASKAVALIVRTAGRQMLHAWRLEFSHPVSHKAVSYEAPLPQDMAELIKKLRNVC